MFRSKIKNRYRKCRNARFYQGDILKDLEFVVGDPGHVTEKESFKIAYAVILSQDCDLEHDYESQKADGNQDKYLLSILICPSFQIEKFSQGKTVKEDWQMNIFNQNEIKKIQKNDSYKRYHYLKEDLLLSIPELIIDFKHFFTLPRDFLYAQKSEKYVASLSELFREELSQRFSNYLSRIGIPEL